MSITQQVRETRTGASLDALRQGRALRRADAARQSRLHAGGRAVAGRRHRRQQRACSRSPTRCCCARCRCRSPSSCTWCASSRGCRSRRGSRIRSSSSCATGFPTPDGVAAMSRVTRVRMLSRDRRGGSGERAAGVGRVLQRAAPAAAARTLALAPTTTAPWAAHPVAVISDAFWRRRFNGAADVLGRELTLNGARFTIVGVAPPASPARGSSRRSTCGSR